MTEVKNYIVSDTTVSWMDNGEGFNSLDAATDEARRKAFTNGKKFGIYSLTAVAEAPEKINDVKVTTV